MCPAQQSLRHLQTAFANFFAKRSAYPTFKKKGRVRDCAEYTRSAFRFDLATQRLTLAKLGILTLAISRPVPSDPSTVTVSRHPSGRYYVSMVVEVADPTIKRVKTGQSVGIDFGVSRLATLSTGETIPNPKHLFHRTALLARAQRRLSRKQRGSNRYRAQRRRVARLHEKIADARKDSLHKLSTMLAKRFDTVYVEDLNLRGMTQNHCLARALSDASIGTAIRMIEAKAETVVKIDRWFPSSKLFCLWAWVDAPLECAPLDLLAVRNRPRSRCQRGSQYLGGRTDRLCTWRGCKSRPNSGSESPSPTKREPL